MASFDSDEDTVVEADVVPNLFSYICRMIRRRKRRILICTSTTETNP